MTEAVAAALPVVSFASGATNSMRGAAYLSGLAEAIVVDVGGTSTDVGQLRRGFPREANSVVEVGGVRTLFRMPDLLSIGLGGGSLVARDPLAVGPHSLGYRLTREALVFGGNTLDRDRRRGRRRRRRYRQCRRRGEPAGRAGARRSRRSRATRSRTRSTGSRPKPASCR